MKKLLQLGLIVAGSLALTMTMANAKCGDAEQAVPKVMKCQSGKCAAGKCGMAGKETKKELNTSKEEVNSTEPAPKAAPSKGKCGQGKCG